MKGLSIALVLLPLATLGCGGQGGPHNTAHEDGESWAVTAWVVEPRYADNAPDEGGPVPMTLETQYRYVDIYTYTHRDTLTYHVTQLARPKEGDPPIGALLGPDADSFFGRVAFYPRPSVTTRVGVNYVRRGEGNDWRKHTAELDPFPPFPSGVVEKTTAVTLSGLWEFRNHHRASFAVTHTRVQNRANAQGDDDSTTSFNIRLTWDF